MKKNHIALFKRLVSNDSKNSENREYKLTDHTLAEQIRTIAREEFNILKQEQSQDNEMQQWKNFKVATGLSVPELSYFLRLLCETGIIKTDNISETVKFFITFFSSTHTQKISEGSFRKNFYTESATVSASVRDILYKLISQSKKGTK